MSKRQFTDTEFIEGIRSNDDQVLNALYKKYYSVVLRYVLNNSGTEEEAQDIYQEAIIVLFRNAGNSNFELSATLQTYIYSIASRLWLKQIHKNSSLVRINNQSEKDQIDVSQEVIEHEERESQIQKMSSCLVDLGEPCKTLIEDFYVNQLSMDQIAEKFGYTNSDNAKTQKYKCLQRLKRLFFERS